MGGGVAFKLAVAAGLIAANLLLSVIIPPKQQRTGQDANAPRSNYGSPIHRVFGTVQLGANIVEAVGVQERKRGKGGVGAKKNTPDTFGSFAALIGEGERSWNGLIQDQPVNAGALSLQKIILNDETWYDVTSSDPDVLTQNASRLSNFTFYSGLQSQTQDAELVAAFGASNVAGFAGYSYIVFNDLNVKDFGGNYPTVKVEVTSNIPPTIENIIRDIMSRCCIYYNVPLIEGIDWGFDQASGFVELGTSVNLLGYTLTLDSAEMKQTWAELAQIFRVALVPNPAMTYRDEYYTRRPHLRVISLIGENATQALEKMGSTTSDYELPWDVGTNPKPLEEIPATIEVQAYYSRNNFEREAVPVTRSTLGMGEDNTLTSQATVNSRQTLANIGLYMLHLGFARGKQLEVDMIPGGETLFPGNSVSWDGSTLNTINGAITTFNRIVGNISKCSIGDDGVSELTGYVEEGGDGLVVYTENEPDLTEQVIPKDLCPEILWFEGPAINSAQTNNRRTVNVLLSAPNLLSDAEEGSVIYSTDGGTTYFTTPLTGLSPNSAIINITSFDPAGDVLARANTVDTFTTITVTVPESVELVSIAESELYDQFKNVIYIPGAGLAAFQTATPTLNPNEYELTNILWNLGHSWFDQSWAPGSQAWLLLAQPYEFVVPSGVNFGDTLTLSTAVESGQDCPVSEATFNGDNAAPRPPIGHNVAIETNQDITFNWIRGISQENPTINPLLTFTGFPNDEPAEIYTIRIFDGASLLRTEIINGAENYTYSLADQTTDGLSSPSNIEWDIVQEGQFQTIDPDTFRSRYNVLGQLIN